jgi:hypothetical protein
MKIQIRKVGSMAGLPVVILGIIVLALMWHEDVGSVASVSFLLPLLPCFELRDPACRKPGVIIICVVMPIYAYSLPVILQATRLGGGSLSNWAVEAIIVNGTVGILVYAAFLYLVVSGSKASAVITTVLLAVVPLALAVAVKVLIPTLPE